MFSMICYLALNMLYFIASIKNDFIRRYKMKTKGFLNLMVAGSAALVLAFAVAASANPDITPFLDSVTGAAPAFTFNYHIVIGGGELIQPGPGTAPPAVTAASGLATGGAVFSDYFTIYDFNGYNGTHSEPAGWALSVLPTNLGSTPGSVTPVPADNPAIPNLTWYKTTGTINGPFTSPNNSFSAGTTVGTTTQLAAFTSDATKQGGDQAGSTIQTVGFTSGPTPPAPPGIPEPATLLLLGSGLAGLAGWRQWRAKKA